METSHDLVWSVDREWRLIYLNPATRAIYGCEREEMLGLRLVDLSAPPWRGKGFRGFQRVLRGENLFHYETEHTARDGRPVYLSLNAMPLRDATGLIIGASGTGVDISHRKQAEMAIEKLAAFPRFNPYAVLEFSSAGEITYYNAAALEMAKSFGHTHPQEILPPAALQIVKACLAKNESRLRCEHANGARTISWSFFPIQQGRVVPLLRFRRSRNGKTWKTNFGNRKKWSVSASWRAASPMISTTFSPSSKGTSALLRVECAGITVMEESLNEILDGDRAGRKPHQAIARLQPASKSSSRAKST